MRHVDQPTLDAIINHQLSARDLARLKEHVRDCTLCSRRLEEYRDVFGEVEAIIPTVERDVIHEAEPRSWRRVLLPRLDDGVPGQDRLLWTVVAAASVAAAIVVAMLLRPPALPPIPSAAPLPPVSNGPAATETPPPVHAAPAARQAPSPPAPASAAPATQAPHRAPPPSIQSAPGFHRVESAQAISALGGAVRLIDGLVPDHFEMSVGTRVPGAVDSLPVVRVVYRDGGKTLLLDEQRRGGLAPGDTLVGTAEAGVSVLQWNSAEFWLSLAGRLPVDSLGRVARMIR
jgi:hypothetical protein